MLLFIFVFIGLQRRYSLSYQLLFILIYFRITRCTIPVGMSALTAAPKTPNTPRSGLVMADFHKSGNFRKQTIWIEQWFRSLVPVGKFLWAHTGSIKCVCRNWATKCHFLSCWRTVFPKRPQEWHGFTFELFNIIAARVFQLRFYNSLVFGNKNCGKKNDMSRNARSAQLSFINDHS